MMAVQSRVPLAHSSPHRIAVAPRHATRNAVLCRRLKICMSANDRSAAEGAVKAGSLLASSLVTAAAMLLAATPTPAAASGLESVDFPASAFSTPGTSREARAARLQALDKQFEGSESLKALLEKSTANKDKNMKAIRDKYCYRQAELGVGDCGGLRYIPGLTKNGVQKRPGWLDSLLGIESPPAKVAADGSVLPEPTMESLFGAEARQ